MADINGVTLSAGSSPTVHYTITYTKSRPNNNQMTYNFKISAALSSSGSFIHNGYALLCTMTVNGSSSQVRIKAADGDNWDGTTPRIRYVSVTCASTTGNATQGVRFKVVSDGRLTLSSGVIDNSSYTVLSSALLTTACGAPTACTVNATLSEGNVTLSWSGASGGTNNAISSYEIQYSDSVDNSTWGAWTALTTVTTTATSGSVSVAPPSTRGYYRRFQVRTRGAAGASYYSGWKISTNSVRKNTVPIAPTAVTASPAAYSDETITLTWSGASGGTSAIKGYQIASRTSTDNSTWTAWSVLTSLTLAASGGNYNPTVSRSPGTYTQFGIWTIDALDVYSSEKISNSIFCNVTACGAPILFSVSATLAEGNATLSWSGATGGAGNAINSYEIQYSDSPDNSTWGAWTMLTTVNTSANSGNVSVSPPATRGNYRRFQIRTRGVAGESFYSDWVVSSNTIRKNILPTPPSSFTATPAIYETATITLTWSGTVQGTSTIKQYVIQKATSTDGTNWSTYEAVATIVSSATSGTYAASVSQVAGTYTRYRISVTDVLDGISAYVTSNTVKKNSPPTAPIIDCPQSGSSTYNVKPRFLITMGNEPDGQTQILEVKIDSGVWYNSVDNPEFFSTNGYLTNGIKTVCQLPTLAIGNHTVTFRGLDSDVRSQSTEVVRTVTILASPFETITADVTHVKAEHIRAIRNAVNIARNYYHLSSFTWEGEVTAGKTSIKDWPHHVMEIRRALVPPVTKINGFDPNSSVFDLPPGDWQPIGMGRPEADVMQQLHIIVFML
jgi:hypothetical protein